ncbi:hypothetical protein Lal_00028440, partial [Lupinus albus]
PSSSEELITKVHISFFKIAVRITQIWYVQIPPKPGHLKMILMDSKRDKIQVSVRKDEFNQWSQCLSENNTYIMHNFNVMRNDLQYKACDHLYRMQFTPGTTLKYREFPDIPDILSGYFRSDLLIVVMLFHAHYGRHMQLKFFNYFNNQPIVQPLVILLTNARVKEGQGNYPPTVSNSWCGSKLLIDEEITNIEKYKESFSTISLSCDTMTQCNSQLSQYSNLSDDDHFLYKASVKSINEISFLTSAEEITCVTVGTTTMFVVGRQGWYYDGYTKCTKKADEGEDDPKAFPLVLDELLARTMVLRVKVQPSYNQLYVIRLSEDPNLIKKMKNNMSVSMTSDHDPEQSQVVTPAKRLSAEFDLDLLQSPVYNSTQLLSSKMTKHMKAE